MDPEIDEIRCISPCNNTVLLYPVTYTPEYILYSVKQMHSHRNLKARTGKYPEPWFT